MEGKENLLINMLSVLFGVSRLLMMITNQIIWAQEMTNVKLAVMLTVTNIT